ncbi:hypothetical protein SAMN05421640_2982 [Ekhidna lutea]|uniref:Uncharacterized protein n=1 Tax=Ekhidna lutea TaxID=447679 RepID=A0A239L6T6_EKHLU|nr:hypothetical protein [Ekhidna lutea]SNT25573.1 hypothetical protein SAMN05421640_2982 [Ekhidna lutea]
MKRLTIYLKLAFSATAILFFTSISAQDEGFIYGKVTTEDGDVYEGPIRWGKEEVYWTDMFNTSKRENKNLDYLSSRELDKLEDRYYDNDNLISRFINISWDDDNDGRFVHEFSTEFGNLKSLRMRSSSRVEVELKNGEYIEVSGSGYNDVGAKLRVIDYELGTIQLSWSNIEKVEFLPTPSNLDEKFGEPLYGTVICDLGEFTGFIQWDHDERVGTDVLDGEEDGDDYEIAFEKIASIERDGYSSSIVTLKSGRKLDLRGTNDVDDDNKGIIVTVKGLGRVDIDWDEFDKVTFKEAPNSGPAYSSFSTPKKLTGKVEVDNGDIHTGEIIFDLDEEYTFELLNGENDDVKFIIPFYNVREITPRGSYSSIVTLNDGSEVTLEDGQDVSDKNLGTLIRTKSDRVYVPWDRIKKITLD